MCVWDGGSTVLKVCLCVFVHMCLCRSKTRMGGRGHNVYVFTDGVPVNADESKKSWPE